MELTLGQCILGLVVYPAMTTERSMVLESPAPYYPSRTIAFQWLKLFLHLIRKARWDRGSRCPLAKLSQGLDPPSSLSAARAASCNHSSASFLMRDFDASSGKSSACSRHSSAFLRYSSALSKGMYCNYLAFFRLHHYRLANVTVRA
jgi:hypothetical protein